MSRLLKFLAAALSAATVTTLAASQQRFDLVAVSESVLSRPHDLILSPDGRHVFVSNLSHQVVKVMDANTLAVVGEIGSDELSAPHDVAMGQQGRLMVADTGNDRLQVLSPDFEFQYSIGGAPPYDFNQPKYFAVDENGSLYVGDQYNHRVLNFDRELKLLGQMGTGTAGKSPNQLNGLEGVAVRGKHVWIADTYNNRVVRYLRRDGEPN